MISTRELLVVCHDIRSDHNVGSIFRTADAAGFTAIYLSGITPGPLDRFKRENKKLTKVSLHAEQYVPYEHVVSITRLIDRLRKQGFTVVSLEQHPRAVPFTKLEKSLVKKMKIALVVGNEVQGLPTAVLKKADLITEIPMYGQKESLNVAVAFGIVAFALRGVQ